MVNISGMSFGVARRRGHHGAQQGRGAWPAPCTPPARAGSRRTTSTAATSSGRSAPATSAAATTTARFSLPRLIDRVAATPSIRAIEIKLSQGAKPGLGGMLPGAKVTPEIAAIRGIPVGVDCKSPAGHSAFRDVDGLLELVETIAAETGLPVGIKSAVGEERFWLDLAARMAAHRHGRRLRHRRRRRRRHRRGSAGLQRPRRAALPVGLPRVYRAFAEHGPAPRRGVHRLGQARHPGERAAGAGHRLRHGQRRPNGDVLHRLHPGPALPHRPLPHRRRHPVTVAAARPRSRPEVGALRQLSRHPALRTAGAWPAPVATSTPPSCRSTLSNCSTST